MKGWLEKASSIGRKSPDQVQPVYSGAEADRRQWLKIEKILMHNPLHEAAPLQDAGWTGFREELFGANREIEAMAAAV